MKPICDCGSELIQIDETCWACIFCDLPQEEMEFVYENICWSCGSDIDSRTCLKSKIPTMGYHCNLCGNDLSKWKERYTA